MSDAKQAPPTAHKVGFFVELIILIVIGSVFAYRGWEWKWTEVFVWLCGSALSVLLLSVLYEELRKLQRLFIFFSLIKKIN
jgi:hypothetical protein